VEKYFFPYDRRADDQFIEPIKNLNDNEPLEPVPPTMDPYYPNSIGRVTDPSTFEMLYHPDRVKEDLSNRGGQKIAGKLAAVLLRKAKQSQLDSSSAQSSLQEFMPQEVQLTHDKLNLTKEEKEGLDDVERTRARYFRRQREKASESEMKRREKEQGEKEKDQNPTGIYQDASIVGRDENA